MPISPIVRLPYMTTLAQRIEEALHELDAKPADLARACGIKPPSVSAWMSGDTKSLKAATAIRAAQFLKVNQLWLTEGRGPKRGPAALAQQINPAPRTIEDDAIPVRMHHVPVVGTTQGGPTTRVWTDGDLPVGGGFGWVSVSSRDRNAFALRVEGSSMAPRYEHGEYVLVEPNRRPEPGDDVIVRLRGGECMIKRLSARRPHELAFDSLSPGYDRITVAPDQIEYLYYVAAGLRAGSYVQHIQADGYEGPERRWHDEPASVKKRSGDQA